MNQNRNFVASLIAAVGAFVLMPMSVYYMYYIFNNSHIDFDFILTFVALIIAVAVFVTETIATIKFAKGKEVSKAFNIARLVLNAVLAVAALVILIMTIVNYLGYGFSFASIFFILAECGVIVCAGAASATAFGFKLKDMLNK